MSHTPDAQTASSRPAFEAWNARRREGVAVLGRRGMLKASLAGVAGLSLPRLMEARALAARAGEPVARGTSVILLWMAGGPSHIDTWDPKPQRPVENRGPFGVIETKVPGLLVCEHLPKQAAMMDMFTIIRSVDARDSNHEPNMVMQTGHRGAEPRLSPLGDKWPAIGSVAAKFKGPNRPDMPPYVAFQTSRTHLAYAGFLGKEHDPFIAQEAARLPIYSLIGEDTGGKTGAEVFRPAAGLSPARLYDRKGLLAEFDRLRRGLDLSGSMDALDAYQRQAVELVIGRRAQEAFDLSREPEAIRRRYGDHLWHQEALLARRLVEAGVSFVTLDLSYHTASGTWDTHGDNIPPYGGIMRGLKPLLPLFDHLITTLVADLAERGLLDDVLVIAMGEFGRTPRIGTQGSSDGRDHWPNVMSMCLAGGGFRHGQVIGASDKDGGQIKHRPVTPGDLAATIYQHLGVPLDATYLDPRGRPHYIVQDGGRPIEELR